MLKLNRKGLMDVGAWKKAGISLPEFDIDRKTEIRSGSTSAPETFSALFPR